MRKLCDAEDQYFGETMMAEGSTIEWTDHSHNHWEGCQKVGPGCDHCYAERRNKRFGKGKAANWGPGAPRRLTSVQNRRKPLRWNKAHDAFFALHGRRQRVFCSSLADWADNDVATEWLVELLDLIRTTPHLDWQLLTKRVGNVLKRLTAAAAWLRGHDNDATELAERDAALDWIDRWIAGDPPHNVWLGITVVNQTEADRDIPKLLALPAHIRFVSVEPLLGPIDLTVIDIDGHSELYPLKGTTGCEDDDGNPAPDLPGLHWVIAGGESGPGARPHHPAWRDRLRDDCAVAGVAFLWKQHGEWVAGCGDFESSNTETIAIAVDGEIASTDAVSAIRTSEDPAKQWTYMHRVGKRTAGRMIDGITHDSFPFSPVLANHG